MTRNDTGTITSSAAATEADTRCSILQCVIDCMQRVLRRLRTVTTATRQPAAGSSSVRQATASTCCRLISSVTVSRRGGSNGWPGGHAPCESCSPLCPLMKLVAR